MSGATLVYVSTHSFLLRPPGEWVYHERGRIIFPKYVPDPEASARVGYPASKRQGQEHFWTRCGKLIYETRDHPRHADEIAHDRWMEAIRLDAAQKLGRPCRACGRAAR